MKVKPLNEVINMQEYLTKRGVTIPKPKKYSVKDFKIDTSHYKSNGPRIIKTIDIKF